MSHLKNIELYVGRQPTPEDVVRVFSTLIHKKMTNEALALLEEVQGNEELQSQIDPLDVASLIDPRKNIYLTNLTSILNATRGNERLQSEISTETVSKILTAALLRPEISKAAALLEAIRSNDRLQSGISTEENAYAIRGAINTAIENIDDARETLKITDLLYATRGNQTLQRGISPNVVTEFFNNSIGFPNHHQLGAGLAAKIFEAVKGGRLEEQLPQNIRLCEISEGESAPDTGQNVRVLLVPDVLPAPIILSRCTFPTNQGPERFLRHYPGHGKSLLDGIAAFFRNVADNTAEPGPIREQARVALVDLGYPEPADQSAAVS